MSEPPPRRGLDHLWAGWRASYLREVVEDPAPLRPDERGSLFERILALPGDDRANGVVRRGETVSAVLNAYPYSSGHLLVLPNQAVEHLDDLEPSVAAALWAMVGEATVALRVAYRPDGINIGANLGAAAGAGVPDHLHVHVLPRWQGDTNFMTTVAEARVMPEPLSQVWDRVVAAWPPADSTI
ncbi:MAG: HIT domain-containing protein [Acidimicrobiia bacterium]|nr:HIT domain-containing protein [Acidimicrobiia bacterium]